MGSDGAQSRRFGERKRFFVGLGALIVLAIGAVASYQVVLARHSLIVGSNALREASRASSPVTRLRVPSGRHRLRAALARAQVEFASARSDLWLWAPVLDHLGWVPRYGGQLAAASPAADTSFYITRCGRHLLDGLEPVWPLVSHPRAGRPLLAGVAPLLDANRAQFLAAGDDADRAALALRRLPRQSGNAVLDAAAARLRATLSGVQAGSRLLALAPLLLGSRAPDRYLVLFQNPAQIRATGGFIGAVNFMTVTHGAVRTMSSGSELPHEIDSVSPPLLEAAYTGEGPWIFRDSNWSPDFPLSARIARWFYGEDTGRWADGVVGIVDNGIVEVLSATGPVYVPAYHETVDAGNVEALAQRYINSSYHGPSAGTSDTIRKQFFGHVFTALVQRIQALPVNRWPALGTAFAAASARRDIMVYDRRPQVQSTIAEAHVDGGLRGEAGDFLAIVDTNWSYNKLNPYVRERARYQVDIQPDLSLNATLTIHYHVKPSPANLEGQGPGYGLEGTKHDYEDLLRVFVPRGAHLTGASGIDLWAPAPAYGLTQFAGRLLVRAGQTRTVTFRYRIPANALSSYDGKHYRLTVRRQPGSNLPAVQVIVHARGGLRLGPTHGPKERVLRAVSVATDAHLSMPISGVVHKRPISLPSLPKAADPYIPFSDFRDAQHPL